MRGKVLPLNEKGLVPIEVSSDASACEGCAAKGFCKLPASEVIEVPRGNLPPQLQTGDTVEIELPPSFRVWLSFSVFILPLLCMLAGALIGATWSERWAIGGGFLGLLIGVLVNWVLNRSLSAQKRIHITRC